MFCPVMGELARSFSIMRMADARYMGIYLELYQMDMLNMMATETTITHLCLMKIWR